MELIVSAMKRQPRDSSIDAMKGLGILCIIMTHADAAFLPGPAGRFAAFGARFVQLFFLLNGYLIWRGTESTLRTGAGQDYLNGPSSTCLQCCRCIMCRSLRRVLSTGERAMPTGSAAGACRRAMSHRTFWAFSG
ncbi:MAG: acyltransferase family protein [Lachnospiraceae bacterium]|nr:acyltransferase family protein [Lachnospiraceae bacterium]